MTDKLSAERRSENMRRIRSCNTSPEIMVRRVLREIGFTGYRLHRRELPGRPDIAFIGRRKALFVHGCFWHGHSCKEGIREPKSNVEYWRSKIMRNRERDSAHLIAMRHRGWAVLTIWECETRDMPRLNLRLRQFLSDC